MKRFSTQITERPINYQDLFHSEIKRLLEDEENEPLIFQHLLACGYVGNKESNDHTWAIDMYDEDNEVCIDSFLYSSKLEYLKDCKTLGIIIINNDPTHEELLEYLNEPYGSILGNITFVDDSSVDKNDLKDLYSNKLNVETNLFAVVHSIDCIVSNYGDLDIADYLDDNLNSYESYLIPNVYQGQIIFDLL